ncbi:MAG: ferrous iron transport protein B [Thermoplasmata archaeon HGW-Thermoplasmata-1]|nr:MAG: ferrous iron transport protein B [Thermoplasmata archaeon HGW-Thermoplasmata-1]
MSTDEIGKIKVALAGNPNVGKSVIFNAITGAHQHVGNWPGVTVEKKVGKRRHGEANLEVVDLPGTYSLTAYSLDEVVTRDYIINEKPDVVVQVVDATNLERNLYLTTQLMELGARVVIALTMCDIAEERGDSIDVKKLSHLIETPVVETRAYEGKNVGTLLDEVVREATRKEHHHHTVGYGKELEEKITTVERLLEKDVPLAEKMPLRWSAVKLLEGDEEVTKRIAGSTGEKEILKIQDETPFELIEAEIADKRYEAIDAVLSQCHRRGERKLTMSDMMDRVFTNKWLGIPLFLALIWAAFQITFTAGAPLMELIDMGVGALAGLVTENVPGWFGFLLGDGIIGGVGAVVIFLPNILLLFLMLALLEESGYMARAAFIMDKLMYSLGLHGKSFIPLLMGFGCSVPAVMATRTIDDKKDRFITILVTPFASCGARLPVYIILAGTFFGRNAGNIIFGLYALGVIVAVLSAKLFRSTLFRGSPAPFVMEMPPYRAPKPRAVFRSTWNNGRMYLKKAGTIILAGVVVVWILASFGITPGGEFGMVDYGGEESLTAHIGKFMEPLFKPLGFDWKIAVALIFGFVAKEIVIGSLGVLYGAGEEGLSAALASDPAFNPAVALGLMVFVLLYMPCMAVVATIKKETGSWGWTAFSIAYSTGIAWLLAFAAVKIGILIGIGG